MTRNPSKTYSHHVANLRELEHALSHTSRLAREQIASRDPKKSLRSLLRLYSFLVGAWIECRLKKLLHEQYGFSETERSQIVAKPSQLERWKLSIDVSFRKHHNISRAPLDEKNLGVAHAARRDALHGVLDCELKVLIEIRNKLAHGQWIYPFKSGSNDVDSSKYKAINNENLQSLQFKYALAGHLANAIHDLVVSPITFERDFEEHFRKLYQVRTNLVTRSYEKYEQNLINKRNARRRRRELS